jgi:glycosyltransferase involved in cell wall biosynthesis
MSSPLVSVLLPVWNAATTLPACLRSVQRQTERRWQCVVVDDGSQDSTLAYARWFAARDQRFVVVSTPHQGLVAALNTGLTYCQGQFVARMDADDLMHRQRLTRQVQAMVDQPELVALGCHVRCFPRQHLSDGFHAYERWLNGMHPDRR